VAEDQWQRARLFPITGIGGAEEQERRGSSALLAVIKAVHEFGRTLTMRVGAPAGSSIETYIEVPFELHGKKCRPDGLIQVSRGQRRWTALVEVKTGHNRLAVDQVETYLEVARQQRFDAVLTISHEIPTTPGAHPVAVDRRKLRRMSLQHLSWGQIHTEALIEQSNKAVSDPEQAWILSEFIRYLEEPKSGALDFDDMGPSWVSVRDSSARQTLRAGDTGTLDVVARFDQLIAFAGMALARRVGMNVRPYLSRRDLADPIVRLQRQADLLAKSGEISGSLQVPNAVAPIDVSVDLRANRVDCSVTVDAPQVGRPTTRVNWLTRQVKSAPDQVQVRANAVRATAVGPTCGLPEVREDPKRLVDGPQSDIRSFTLTLSQPAGTKRGQGRGSFVKSVVGLVDTFYSEIVQNLKAWTPAAPKVQGASSPSLGQEQQRERVANALSAGDEQVPDGSHVEFNEPAASAVASIDVPETADAEASVPSPDSSAPESWHSG
jgi:hypothetical protein